MTSCPRCDGSLFEEDGDIVCLSCGWRQVDGAKPPSAAAAGNGRTGVMDPYDEALAALTVAADAIEKQITRYARGLTQRRDQARRLRKALAVMGGSWSGRGSCPKCAAGYRSYKHRDECRDKPVEAVA